jgi:hypothetical protein
MLPLKTAREASAKAKSAWEHESCNERRVKTLKKRITERLKQELTK